MRVSSAAAKAAAKCVLFAGRSDAPLRNVRANHATAAEDLDCMQNQCLGPATLAGFPPRPGFTISGRRNGGALGATFPGVFRLAPRQLHTQSLNCLVEGRDVDRMQFRQHSHIFGADQSIAFGRAFAIFDSSLLWWHAKF